MRRFVGPFLSALSSRGFPFDGFAIHSYPAGNLGSLDRVNDIVSWQSTVVNQLGAEGASIIQQTYLDSQSLGIDAAFWYRDTADPLQPAQRSALVRHA